jgi:16S rRNA C967 or C1407 C5-methylase (RsmB/RsmF family)
MNLVEHWELALDTYKREIEAGRAESYAMREALIVLEDKVHAPEGDALDDHFMAWMRKHAPTQFDMLWERFLQASPRPQRGSS